MEKIEKIERIDRYLHNRLSGAEKRAFEQEVEDHPSFRQEVEDMKISQEVIRSYAMREEIKAIRKAMLQENKSHTSASSPSFRFYAVRVAAGVLLLIVALAALQYASLSGDKLYAEKAMMYPMETTRSGPEAGDITQEEEAFVHYQQEDYSQYIENYERLSAPSLKAVFLAGNAYLQLDKTEKAVAAFGEVLERNAQSSEKLFQEDAEYFMALALIRNDEYAQARSILETIANHADHKYHTMVNAYYLWKLKMMEWKAS